VLKLAALVLAAASSAQTPALISTAPWFEKVTVTLSGDGKAQSCKYETNLRTPAGNACEVTGGGKDLATSTSSPSSSGSKEELTRITFERQFLPGLAQPGEANMQPGDTLLGKQVMALAIDAAGAVKGCKVVATGGEMTPEYGCTEAQTERFDTVASAPRQGFMTVLVYGHEEHVA
jgi:hypothetical protein